MRIGLIGSGHIGGTLARLFVQAGHEVALSNARGPEYLHGLVAELAGLASATTPLGAASFGELVVVSIPFGRYREVPVRALARKVVVDTMNYYPSRDAHIAELDSGERTSSELLQELLAHSRVVKAFNTQNWRELGSRSRPRGARDRVAVPLAGDDELAKRTVARLINEIGFDACDLGRLAEGGRHMQPGSPIYSKSLTGQEIERALAA